MPSITKLKSQKNKKRVNLFIDNSFAFGLSLDEVFKNNLSVGQKLSKSDIDKLFFKSNFEKLYNKALNLLSYRPRSKKEIEFYLKKNLFKSKVIDGKLKEKMRIKIINQLEKLKYIDDLKFSQWWVKQRLEFRPKGKRILKAELFQKGIDKDIIESVLDQVDDNKLLKLAQKVVNKKFNLYKSLPKLKLKKKLYDHLIRRGFDYKTAKTVIDEIMEK